jgi:hypothetical protein
MIVRERKKVIDYIRKRQIGTQYLKAKKHLKADRYEMVDFKQRKPQCSPSFVQRGWTRYAIVSHEKH